MTTYTLSLTPNSPNNGFTVPPNKVASGLLQIYGASFSMLDKHWSLPKCRDGNFIEVGWCPAIPPGQPQILNFPNDVFSKSVMWLRLMFAPGVPAGTLIPDLKVKFRFNVVGPGNPLIELYVGTARVIPDNPPGNNGTIALPLGTNIIQELHLTNINALQLIDGYNFLDILVRVCSQANPVQGTFNFQEASGDIII